MAVSRSRLFVVGFAIVILLPQWSELAAADSASPQLSDFRTVETCLITARASRPFDAVRLFHDEFE